jgi:predicted double-glycine peptidase
MYCDHLSCPAPLDPRLLPIALGLAGAAGGGLRFAWLARRCPEVTIEDVHLHCPWLTRGVLLSFTAAALLLLLNSSPERAALIPLWLQYWSPTAIWGSVVATAAFVFSLGALAGLRPLRLRGLLLPALGACVPLALLLVQWKTNAPLASTLGTGDRQFGVVRQTDRSSSEPAALATLLGHFGVTRSEREAARLLGTTARGTSPAQLYYGITHFGLACEALDPASATADRLRAPALLYIDHPDAGSEGHVVVLTEVDGDRLEIWDSLVGIWSVSMDAFATMWHGRGFLVSGQVRANGSAP